jgi:hypothetical protein
MIAKIGLVFLMLCAATTFSVSGSERAHQAEVPDPLEAMKFGDVFFWQTLGPDAFLDVLKRSSTIYYVHGIHKGGFVNQTFLS